MNSHLRQEICPLPQRGGLLLQALWPVRSDVSRGQVRRPIHPSPLRDAAQGLAEVRLAEGRSALGRSGLDGLEDQPSVPILFHLFCPSLHHTIIPASWIYITPSPPRCTYVGSKGKAPSLLPRVFGVVMLFWDWTFRLISGLDNYRRDARVAVSGHDRQPRAKRAPCARPMLFVQRSTGSHVIFVMVLVSMRLWPERTSSLEPALFLAGSRTGLVIRAYPLGSLCGLRSISCV